MANQEVLNVIGPFGHIAPTYTLVTLGFPVEEESQQGTIIEMLKKAANDIIEAYPWLAGQVITEGATEMSTGTFKIVRYPPHEGKSRFIHHKDCMDLCPSYQDLVEHRAPSSMLDGSVLSPAYGFANMYPDHVTKPVTMMQANFIRGGLLLTVATYHSVMDANGNEQFIRQFASLCCGEKLSEEYIRWGNADQDTIVPPLKEGEDVNTEMMLSIRKPSSLGDPSPIWPPPVSSESGNTWRTFRFSRSLIAALKIKAFMPEEKYHVPYVSSNDAITAFIWLGISIARSAGHSENTSTRLIRAVNTRRRLKPPVHEGYMGHLLICCFSILNLLSTAERPSLPTVAKTLRYDLMNHDFDRETRALFHALKTTPDKSTFNYGAKMNPETDLMITSFVAQKLYETEFGALGKPDFIRRPKLPDARGLCYMMPLTREGDVDICVSLEDEEFEALMRVGGWKDLFLG